MPSSNLRPGAAAAAAAGSKRSTALHLSSLPRFHPGNFQTSMKPATSSPFSSASMSAVSSAATSPPSEPSTPNQNPTITYSTSTTPHSRPAYHSRQYSDAQRKLHAYQREVMTRNYYGSPYTSSNSRPLTPTSPSAGDLRSNSHSPYSPRSPILHPLGSPGPVTPFELEGEQDSYLFASSSSAMDRKQVNENAKEQILETFIKKEGSPSASPGSDTSHRVWNSPKGLKRGDPTSHRSALSR